ncbi:ABC transporter permease [Pontibacillus marinus]|uniref:ABC transporter permease n=1 Tax=Pontibacillus marinus BH030004 = DSM 16465 TaxID=1385511 RepID=A0A0A5GKM0_9BACI|nr:ABC transporter permease [Pontibacillus marinus]KGX91778.1 ABC transporter permease [Pontibacillus marinus BH030004 = DSM 16465]
MERSTKKAYTLLSPSLLLFLVFLAVPVIMIIIISFTKNDGYGGIIYEFTLQNYKIALESLYLKIFLRSVYWSFLITVTCLLIGYPFAYFISHIKKYKNLLLFLVIIPFWTNLLVRTYAWIILLQNDGVINGFLKAMGFIEGPIQMLYTPGAILVGLIYGFLPFMVLPLYTSIEKLDRSYLEAAEDLGASPIKTFFNVTVPLTMPGIITGCFITFIPALGIFVVPDMLGGSKAIMIGNIIRDDFQINMNWQLGASVSVLIMTVVLASVFIFLKLSNNKKAF